MDLSSEEEALVATERQFPEASNAPRAQLEITVTPGPTTLVLWPRGEIDMASAPMLAECLGTAAQECDQAVVVDLTEVTFLDSTGLKALLEGRKALADRGLSMTLRNPTDPVRRVLSICDVGSGFLPDRERVS
jgi:anti-sigma B factor antagonist